MLLSACHTDAGNTRATGGSFGFFASFAAKTPLLGATPANPRPLRRPTFLRAGWFGETRSATDYQPTLLKTVQFKPSCRRAFPRPRHQTAMPNNGRPEYRAIVTHRKESRLIRKAELCLSRTFRLSSETTAASLAASDPIRILTWLETETQEQEGYCLTSERKRNNLGLAGMRGARSNF